MFVEEMRDYLEQYYEAAGFADFYEQVLKGMSDEDVIKMYMDTFGKQEDIVIEKEKHMYFHINFIFVIRCV